MAKIKIHAGDFLEGSSNLSRGSLWLRTKENTYPGEHIQLTELETVEIATEENLKKLGGTLGWGLAGAVVLAQVGLGPVGLLAGLLVGGRKKKITFIAKFKDGRKILASTDSKTFTKLQAVVF